MIDKFGSVTEDDEGNIVISGFAFSDLKTTEYFERIDEVAELIISRIRESVEKSKRERGNPGEIAGSRFQADGR